MYAHMCTCCIMVVCVYENKNANVYVLIMNNIFVDLGRATTNLHIRTLSGIQPARRERRKAKKRQLRGSNPGCLTKAAIDH